MHPSIALSCLLSAATATAQWSLQPTTTAPTSRTDAAMAYDLGQGKTVLFGGAGVTPFALRNDTWTHNGTDWTLATPSTSPTGRFGASMVFDPTRNVSVLFGGIASLISIGLPSNQTWEWNGTDWTQATPTTSPAGRAHYGLAYDLARQKVVMFGGSTNPGLLMTSNQTWEYDGLTWVQVAMTSAQNPGPRQYPGMTYHAGLNRTVLFGGINPQTGGNSDTWMYNGSNWTIAPVLSAPPGPRNAPKMVYDHSRGVCLLQGGAVPTTGAAIDETWEFDGAQWRQVTAPMPTSRSRFAMAYDTTAQRVVLFGGVGPANLALTDTWTYGAFVDGLGTGCPGSNGVPLLAGATLPRIGGTFASTLTNLAASAQLGAVVAGLFAANPPTPLDGYGMPGCTLWANIDAMVFLPVLSGTMTSQLGIPNDPSMFGVVVHEQGLSLDAGANAAGLVVSNAIRAHIGW